MDYNLDTMAFINITDLRGFKFPASRDFFQNLLEIKNVILPETDFSLYDLSGVKFNNVIFSANTTYTDELVANIINSSDKIKDTQFLGFSRGKSSLNFENFNYFNWNTRLLFAKDFLININLVSFFRKLQSTNVTFSNRLFNTFEETEKLIYSFGTDEFTKRVETSQWVFTTDDLTLINKVTNLNIDCSSDTVLLNENAIESYEFYTDLSYFDNKVFCTCPSLRQLPNFKYNFNSTIFLDVQCRINSYLYKIASTKGCIIKEDYLNTIVDNEFNYWMIKLNAPYSDGFHCLVNTDIWPIATNLEVKLNSVKSQRVELKSQVINSNNFLLAMRLKRAGIDFSYFILEGLNDDQIKEFLEKQVYEEKSIGDIVIKDVINLNYSNNYKFSRRLLLDNVSISSFYENLETPAHFPAENIYLKGCTCSSYNQITRILNSNPIHNVMFESQSLDLDDLLYNINNDFISHIYLGYNLTFTNVPDFILECRYSFANELEEEYILQILNGYYHILNIPNNFDIDIYRNNINNNIYSYLKLKQSLN